MAFVAFEVSRAVVAFEAFVAFDAFVAFVAFVAFMHFADFADFADFVDVVAVVDTSGHPLDGAARRPRGTSGGAFKCGQRPAPTLIGEVDLCSSRQWQGGQATGPRRPDDAPRPPRGLPRRRRRAPGPWDKRRGGRTRQERGVDP